MAGLNDIVFAIFLPPNQAASCTLDNVAVGTILCYQISNMILINAGAGVAVDSNHTTTLYCSFTFLLRLNFMPLFYVYCTWTYCMNCFFRRSCCAPAFYVNICACHVHFTINLLTYKGGWVAEWLACRVRIAVATLSVNSLRQTVHTLCASVHQAAKLVAALLRVAGVTAGLAESNGSRRVYDSHHLQADCQEPRSAPEPCAR